MTRWLPIPLLFSCALLAPIAGSAPAPLKTTEIGRGPTVVLLHGMGSTRTYWMPTARRLLGAHRVVLMDLPGHGDSPLPDPFSLEAAAAMVSERLAAYPAESTVVVGQGVGGLFAVLAASANPARQRGVIAIDAVLRPEMQIPEQQQRYFLQMLDSNYDNFLKMMYTRMGRDSAQGVAIHAQAALTPAATIKAYLVELLKVDAAKALRNFKPAFLFVGTEKNWSADKSWGAVARAGGYEDTTLAARRLTGCGNLVAAEQPDSLAAVVAAFTARALAKK